MLELRVAAEEIVHQNVTVDTHDRQDHSYAGVMFNVQCKPAALQYLEVSALWVRGDLGPITVWATPDSFDGKETCEDLWETGVDSLAPGDKINGWTLVYAGNHEPSRATLVQCKCSTRCGWHRAALAAYTSTRSWLEMTR